MFKKVQNKISAFLKSEKDYVILTAIAAGLYPMIYYFSRQYNLVNSWSHLLFFTVVFLVFPVCVFWFLNKLASLAVFKNWKIYILPFLNLFFFLVFIQYCISATFGKKRILLVFVLALGLAYVFKNIFKKIIVLQLLLATIGLFSLLFTVIEQNSYSNNWKVQPDAIASLIFKKQPNVYYIQPDGYVNTEELNKGYYKIDNQEFNTFLKDNKFIDYLGFRSNYDATLATNSSIFTMKHHYYYGHSGANEVSHARKTIISENIVLNTFKKNNYQTYFLTEYPYLMLNKPKMGYDKTNFKYAEIPFIGNGLETYKDVVPSLDAFLNEDSSKPKFFFIEVFNPKHISNGLQGEKIHARYKVEYKENLKQANLTLKEIINTITQKDTNALIVIMADHGGYLGFSTLQEGNTMHKERDKLYSMFSSKLAIRWPNNEAFIPITKLQTTVNLFRVLFSYLAEDTSYLDYLENDSSYGLIKNGAPKGVYQLIDENGQITSEKINE